MVGQRLITRRRFLQGGAAFLLGFPYVISSTALGKGGRPPPSRRIAMGCIGTGGMGKSNIRSFLWREDVQMVAACDVDSERRKEARDLVEKHYAEHSPSGNYQGCAEYSDFRELIARDDLDAVIIATPDHWHIPMAIMAAKAGKDIYCEKPLSLTIAEGRALSDTVKRYGTVCQTGSQQRSSRRFRFACELVRNGRIGKLQAIKTVLVSGRAEETQPAMPVPKGFDYDLWLGPAPWAPYTEKRCHFNFRYIFDYSGGALTDWGAHHIDIAQWGNGTEFSGPIEVEGKGEFPEDGLYNTALHYDLHYRYANGVKLHCTSRGQRGVTFEGTEGWIFVNRKKIDAHPKSLLTSVIGPNEIHLYASHWHQGNFAECVRTRNRTAAPAEIAHRSITICHLGNIAMRLGRKLRWNPENERFVNDPQADRMIVRTMRSPWRL